MHDNIRNFNGKATASTFRSNDHNHSVRIKSNLKPIDWLQTVRFSFAIR